MFGLEILKSRLKDAPKTSGVYLFKNKKDIPIYIGKAINIKRRLSNYGNLPKLPRRLQKMVSQTVNIDFELTESERNALLLEALLIKKFSPRYNIRLKDDKSFPLIKITNGAFPRLTRFRNDFSNEDKVFGPFTSALKTDKVIKILQKSFKLRSCNDSEFKNRTRPCLLYDLKQCSAPCVSKVDENEYKNQVSDTIKFFQGSQKKIFNKLEKQMVYFSESQNYEKAAELRDSIQSLNFIIREEVKISTQDTNYDYIHIDDKKHLALVMTFIDGQELTSSIRKEGMSIKDTVKLLFPVAQALDHLHKKGIIHRDIKGANVLVSEAGVAKLADFGCSKQLQGAATGSMDESLRSIRGSIPWMAPEVMGGATPTARAATRKASCSLSSLPSALLASSALASAHSSCTRGASASCSRSRRPASSA